MGEKLFIVEGPSGSGKSTLLSALTALESEGFIAVRGIPSQYPEENKKLTPKSRTVLGCRVPNFKEALRLPREEGAELFRVCTRVAVLQFAEAKRLMDQHSATVLLDRSIISLLGVTKLVVAIAINSHDPQLYQWAREMQEEIKVQSYKGITGVNGIVHMEVPFIGIANQTTLTDYAAWESICINNAINELANGHSEFKIPVLTLDPNLSPLEERISLTRTFINTN